MKNNKSSNVPKFKISVVHDGQTYSWDGEKWEEIEIKDDAPSDDPNDKHEAKHATKHHK